MYCINENKDAKAYLPSFSIFPFITPLLKAIKNATGTSVIFPINISLIQFVFVLTNVPNVGEHFTKT